MLHSKANWKILQTTSDAALIEDVPLDVSPVVEKLLVQRGIETASAAKKFLSPSLEDLNKPELLNDMDKAVLRVKEAITSNEKILVYGDYDADGVTSTAVLIKALEELGANCTYYIPNRFTEGYGPNEEAFRKAHANGFSLIITVDNGINAIHEADVARALGIDLIITDHHEPQEELPDAFAIIHPILSENYPFKELAGVGVAFKMAEALLGYFPKQLLELVAIGTIADLVPLKEENRILSFYGLRELSVSKIPGIIALKASCNLEGTINEEDVGFRIGPRLNAVGRLQDASLAVELLLTESLEEAAEFAEEVNSLNQERQRIVEEITKEAEQVADPSHGILIVYRENWNEGVLGIVASRLVKQFERPAIVLNRNPETNELKGSARSIPAFDLFSGCMKVRHLFSKFGGHAQAAGMTIPEENIAELQRSLDEIIAEELNEEDFKEEILISDSLEIGAVTQKMIEEMNQLAPYGMGNPKPVFKITAIPSDKRQIGSKKNHLKLQLAEKETVLDCIGFGMGEYFYRIAPHTPVQAVGELGINEWNGNRKPQLMIQDMKINEWQLFDYRGRKNIDWSFLHDKKVLAVSIEPLVKLNTHQIDYQTENRDLVKTDHLVLVDLPERLDDLIRILQATKPENIYAAFQLKESAYLMAFPAREDFVWLYALIHKQKTIDLKQAIQTIMKMKSWSKDRVIFMIKVFQELDFIAVSDGVVKLHPNPAKQSLDASETYQARLRQQDIEQKLYYSNYEQFKNWFRAHMDDVWKPEEELVNGP